MLSLLAVLAAAGPAVASFAGEATFYGGNTKGGMCSFSTYDIPDGIYGTALSDSNWDGSEACGGCVEVTGPNGMKITAMVTDQCPGCGTNHLDLYPDAFSQLADPSEGIIDVTWDYVDCPISTPLQVHMKSGVSPYYFSAQIVNANKRVAELEYSTDGGSTWKGGLERQPYNFFLLSSGTGTNTVSVRAESVDGDRVVVNDVEVKSDNLVTAQGNF
ncbi:carbohydrate-binding module family 63 protein [Cercospora zeae-maydis SCOH1-5]|uniref:Carbohydrate-binding module family 63 protein n=1 Tax=Cercospora zeae-maydis SCOH1-5 TaxID=717836 RepID=A0A6A6FI91_9PEZI|nr:carbohydrate-binding module family 63 protein [Cercospora zeae-maydis SCOH1-5]